MTTGVEHPGDPLHWLTAELDSLQEQNLARSKRAVQPLSAGRCQVDGRDCINFATNDYLDLSGDPRLAEAATQAIAECGVGSRGSALLTGQTRWHQQLEERLAHFEQTQAALLFPTGYAANLGVIAALTGPDDVVLGDRLNHASLIDGCRLSGARLRVFPHADVERLDRELHKHRSTRRRLVVTDSLFSMDGDLAPLPELCDVAESHGAILLVDEAHATGVLGESGRGAAEHYDVKDRIDIRIGTLSKSVGSQGGFVVGSRVLIDWLTSRARTQVFSTALSPACCAAACAALDIIEHASDRRSQLQQLSRQLRDELTGIGLPVSTRESTPIVPVVIGDAGAALNLSKKLERSGFVVPAIRPPSVPYRTSRLRISLSAAHTRQDIRALVSALSVAGS